MCSTGGFDAAKQCNTNQGKKTVQYSNPTKQIALGLNDSRTQVKEPNFTRLVQGQAIAE